MTASLAPEWTTTQDPQLVEWRGAVGRVVFVPVDSAAVKDVDWSLEGLGVRLNSPRKRFDLLDVCPDPLVFAVNHGLPRLRVLDQQIDGGSSFTTTDSVVEGVLTCVPRIADIVERRSRSGRRMIKTVYETTVYTARGVLVGSARGISLDVEAEQRA